MSKEYNDVLTGVKVGDIIALPTYAHWGEPSSLYNLMQVEKATSTQITVDDGNRFRKSDGKKIGGSYRDYAFVPTLEQLEENRKHREQYQRKHKARKWLDETVCKRIKSLTVEQIEAMKAAYESVTGENLRSES